MSHDLIANASISRFPPSGSRGFLGQPCSPTNLQQRARYFSYDDTIVISPLREPPTATLPLLHEPSLGRADDRASLSPRLGRARQANQPAATHGHFSQRFEGPLTQTPTNTGHRLAHRIHAYLICLTNLNTIASGGGSHGVDKYRLNPSGHPPRQYRHSPVSQDRAAAILQPWTRLRAPHFQMRRASQQPRSSRHTQISTIATQIPTPAEYVVERPHRTSRCSIRASAVGV